MIKWIIGVSGGIDSMVMFDMMVNKFNREEILVAHFNHGTRESAEMDCDFVKKKCLEYGVKFQVGFKKLGEEVSEEEARKWRWRFFEEIKQNHAGATFCTAHHLDDLVETCAINFLRGTGWRGLAGLSREVGRPFLDGTFGMAFGRREILKYAAENKITFRWDPTNASEKYLRNRVRTKVNEMAPGKKKQIYDLWLKQIKVGGEIDEIMGQMLEQNLKGEKIPREWFREMDDEVSDEILKLITEKKWKISITRPQRKDLLKAIREYLPGKKFNLPKDLMVRMGREDFWLEYDII